MTAVDATHDPGLTSWVRSAREHPDFPIQNLPLGIFDPAGRGARPGVAIGDEILDLRGIAALLPRQLASALEGETLNALFALPSRDRVVLRHRLVRLLSDDGERDGLSPHLHRASDCTMHLPARIGDYSDFYVGIHHATNVGRLFRPDNPLLPNYKWVPIAYHGRASSVRPSGVPVRRPSGQSRLPDREAPAYGPSRRLDYELELGVWIGAGNAPGEPIPIGEAADHVAGLCLLNDWSARDIQAWEYQPLGPFGSKNFHSTVSPWVVTAEALAPFRIAQPDRPAGDPAPLPYLFDVEDQAQGGFAITMEVLIASAAMRTAGVPPMRLSRGSCASMYWTIAQMIAHHTCTGCDLNPGDLLGTGTLSTASPDGYGSLLEIARGGAEPIDLPTGEKRVFLADGDELTITGRAAAHGFVPIGFGACRATILPALD